MNYTNEKVRRQNRLLSEDKAFNLLRNGEYGVLSMSNENGESYGIPINFVWDSNNYIYFHCAPEGEKLEFIKNNNNVSFCVVGHTNVISNKFTTEYESIIVKGKAEISLSDSEKQTALELILDKYSPLDKEVGLQYAKGSFERTSIIRLNIESISGKCKGL